MGYSENDIAYENECKREAKIKEANKLKEYLITTCQLLHHLDVLKTNSEINEWYLKHLEDKIEEEKENKKALKLSKIRSKIKTLKDEELKLLKGE